MRQQHLRTILAVGCLAWAGLMLPPRASAEEEATAPTTTDAVSRVYVELNTTRGPILLELNAEKAPITVANFLEYVRDGFYDDTIFHRVISNFMIQGGGYTSDMQRKTEGLRPDIKNEWKNGLSNERGTIAMARRGNQPDSASSQFFINVVDNDILDKPRDGAGYAVFGRVVAGMDVVDEIRMTKVRNDPRLRGMGKVVPVEPVVIESTEILVGSTADQVAEAVKKADEMDPPTAEAQRVEELRRQFEEAIQEARNAMMQARQAPGPAGAEAREEAQEAQKRANELMDKLAEAQATVDTAQEKVVKAAWPADKTDTSEGAKQRRTELIAGVKVLAEQVEARLAAEKEAEEARMAAEKQKQIEAKIAELEEEAGKPVVKTDSGLIYVVLEEGEGDVTPKEGDRAKAHYTGWLLDGTEFDSSRKRGTPLPFTVTEGPGGVIKGWVEAVKDMKVGERRKLLIPPELGYGKRGSPPRIPPDSYLIFDMELVSIGE